MVSFEENIWNVYIGELSETYIICYVMSKMSTLDKEID